MDNMFVVLIFVLIGGFVLYAIQSSLVKSPGNSLNQKFVSLGTLQGKTFMEISAVVGLPQSVSSSIGVDKQPIIIRQWMATGYHIVLLFDSNDICLGVNHETKV
jgi:hypothetical protein